MDTISNLLKSRVVITKWDLNTFTIPTAILLNKGLYQCHLYLVNYMFSDPSVKMGC